jgi:hypothetical protein
VNPKPPLDTPRALVRSPYLTSSRFPFERWTQTFALLAALALMGIVGWALLRDSPGNAPRKPSPAQAPAKQMPAEKPHLTLDPELVS